MDRKWMLVLALCLAIFTYNPVFGSESTHSSHGSDHDNMDMGMKIHETHVGDFMFVYYLIDMKEKMKDMKNMPKMKDTHHLMLQVKDMHGNVVDKAKVGYMIEGPDKSSQKKMAMAMNKGFGADVTFEHGKKYVIKSKVLANDKKLSDSFKFELSH